MKLGCPHGCPLDYHEDSCPVAIRQAERERQQEDAPRLDALARELYEICFQAGYAAAMRDLRARPAVRVERADQ